MAATVSATITGVLVDGSGAVMTSANVKAQRVDPDSLVAATVGGSDTATATSNSSTGVFSLAVTAYDTAQTTWKVTFPNGQYAYIALPANAKTVDVGYIQTGATPSKTVKDITSQITPRLYFIGQDIASASTIIVTCDQHSVTGTTAITAITSKRPLGKPFMLLTTSTASIADSGNFKLSAAFTGSADDWITLATLDGTNYYEVARSAN